MNTMAQNYFQPEIETMPVEEIKKLQSERLVKQVKHIYDNVPFYKNKMDEAGIKPEDIHGVEDLHKLPFTEKDDLRDQYPYGLLAMPLKDCVRIQSTSGTTGRRVVAFYTQHDLDLWEDCCARAIVAAGGTRRYCACILWLWIIYRWFRLKWRFPQSWIPNDPNVFR